MAGISNAEFSANGNIKVSLDNGMVTWVPNDMANASRQLVQAWVDAGHVIAPYVPPAPTAEQTRIAGIKVDAGYIDLLSRASTATAAQIDAWFAANVTTLAQARAVLASIVKFLATKI
jgi:hypothetical protein